MVNFDGLLLKKASGVNKAIFLPLFLSLAELYLKASTSASRKQAPNCCVKVQRWKYSCDAVHLMGILIFGRGLTYFLNVDPTMCPRDPTGMVTKYIYNGRELLEASKESSSFNWLLLLMA